MLACEEGHVAAAEYLIAHGADVNSKNNVRYNLMICVCTGLCECQVEI